MKVNRPVAVYKKGWGSEQVIYNARGYCGKLMDLKKGKQCSMHFHVLKQESFLVLSGKIEFESIDKFGDVKHETLESGDTVHIERFASHRFTGVEDSQFVEFSTEDCPSDSYRVMPGDSQK
jgi:quercetin dioxygenase-like cupin family protein